MRYASATNEPIGYGPIGRARNLSEDLMTGIPQLDHQHEELFVIINRLSLATDANNGTIVISEVLAFLDSYVLAHFATEEALMESHNYPNLDQHRNEHHEFVLDVQVARHALITQGPTTELALRTYETLACYLEDHIRKADVQLGSFLRSS